MADNDETCPVLAKNDHPLSIVSTELHAVENEEWCFIEF